MALHTVTTKQHVERKTAIEEVTRGQELLVRLQSHIRSATHDSCDFDGLELANNLSEGVLQALTVALSVLTSSETMRAEGSLPCSNGKVKRVATEDENMRIPKRRRNITSWTKVTAAPHFDGYQWRKYGQKMILHSKYPREYYRCTYQRDQGCLATKQIQQEDSCDSSPMFLVIYNNQHTCGKTTLPTAECFLPSVPSDLSFLTFESNESLLGFSNVINNEQFLRSSSSTSLKEESNGKILGHPRDGDCSPLVNQAMSSELMEMMEHVLSISSFDIDDVLTASCPV